MRRTLLLTNTHLSVGKSVATLQHTHKPQVLTDPLGGSQDLLSEVKGDRQGGTGAPGYAGVIPPQAPCPAGSPHGHGDNGPSPGRAYPFLLSERIWPQRGGGTREASGAILGLVKYLKTCYLYLLPVGRRDVRST